MRNPDESDMFSFHEGKQPIPDMGTVPETPEEKRNRRLLILAAILLALSVIAAAVVAVMYFQYSAAVEETALAAGDSGRPAAIEEALEVIGDHETALRARLVSSAAFEADPTYVDRAEALVGEVDGDSDPDIRAARAYLALCRFEVEEAASLVSSLTPAGTYAAEHHRIQALVALAQGDAEAAERHAEAARSDRPESMRHASLAAAVAIGGDPAAALDALSELDATSAPVRIVKARALVAVGEDFEGASVEAEAVRADDEATAVERAWASLVLSRVALEADDTSAARPHVDEAMSSPPLGHEAFRVAAGEIYLRLGADEEAQAAIADLPDAVSADGGRRALLRAGIALSTEDLDAAEQALEDATPGPSASFLRARVLEARGNADGARTAYEETARDPALALRALTHLALLELSLERAEAAIGAADRLLALDADDPSLVEIAVRAHVAGGNGERGLELAEAGLSAHEGEPRLLTAKATALGALERWPDALVAARAAVETRGDDADLLALYGDAARHVGEDEEASEAYGRALSEEPEHPIALIGVLALAVAADDADAAAETAAKLEDVEIDSLELDRLRARQLVLSVAGRSGLNAVRALLRRRSRDPHLHLALGDLFLQAELYAQSLTAYAHALDDEETGIDAVLGRAMAYARRGRKRPAERALGDLPPRRELPARARARRTVIEGYLSFEDQHLAVAGASARRALSTDRGNAEANWLLALTLEAASRDATRQLRAAARGTMPPPDAFARYALLLGEGEEACALARRYQLAAPRGALNREVRRLVASCE